MITPREPWTFPSNIVLKLKFSCDTDFLIWIWVIPDLRGRQQTWSMRGGYGPIKSSADERTVFRSRDRVRACPPPEEPHMGGQNTWDLLTRTWAKAFTGLCRPIRSHTNTSIQMTMRRLFYIILMIKWDVSSVYPCLGLHPTCGPYLETSQKHSVGRDYCLLSNRFLTQTGVQSVAFFVCLSLIISLFVCSVLSSRKAYQNIKYLACFPI